MCRVADPFCHKKTPVFENFGRSLPYDPLPAPAIDNLLGRRFPPLPAHLSRVLFVPKHNHTVAHLPIYEVTDAYRRAVKDAAPGSNGYRVGLWFMDRPKGDGTDAAEVRLSVNNHADRVTVEERSLNPSTGAVATINLPSGRGEPTIITGPGQEARRSVRVAPHLPTPTPGQPPRSVVDPKVPQYPVLIVDDDATVPRNEEEAQWQIRPVDPGSACYYQLVRRNRRRRPDDDDDNCEEVVAAVYHHAGPHLRHPVDHSEGVLLVPETRSPHEDVLAVAMLVVLLWHVRELDIPGPPLGKTSLSTMFGHLRIGQSGCL